MTTRREQLRDSLALTPEEQALVAEARQAEADLAAVAGQGGDVDEREEM